MSEKDVNPRPNEITCLYEITRALHATLDLRKALYKVLDLLSDHLGMNRSSITLLNPDTSEIHIEVAHGISNSEKKRGRYKLGEGVTGRVIETGRPMAVPHIDAEPLFLGPSYMAASIKLLSADRASTIIAMAIWQHVRERYEERAALVL